MEHIEEAGIHSGDSSSVLPPHKIEPEHLDTLRAYTRRLTEALRVVGLCNIQFAISNGRVYVLEVNPRASRTVPFVSKVTGVPLAKIATLVATGGRLSELWDRGLLPPDRRHYRHLPYTAVKAAVLPFGRFPGADTVLGPEMKSTGEVMGIDADPGAALAKALVSSGAGLPTSGTVFVSVANRDKRAVAYVAGRLAALGFRLLATRGTAGVLERSGIAVTRVAKVSEGGETVVDLIRRGGVDLVINTPFGRGPRSDGYYIRTAAAQAGIPCVTTVPGVMAALRGIEALRAGATEPRSLQEWHALTVAGRPTQPALEAVP
jgi:carbamoyl-phosphate synthase large subunit